MGMHPESGVTLRRDLTAAANEYAELKARELGFIGMRVAAMFGVGMQAATYPVICRENFLKREEDSRQGDGRYNFIDGKFGSRSYECVDRGLSSLLDDATRRRYSTFLDFEVAMTRILTHKILLNHEYRTATLAWATGSAQSVSNAWSDATNGTPLANIATGLDTIRQNTGIPQSMVSLVLPQADFTNMCRTAEVIDQVKYTFSGSGGVRPAILKAEHIATILQIKEVLIAGAGYDIKEEGITPSVSSIWTAGKAQLAVLADADAPLEEPSAWRTLLWKEDSPELPVMERYYSDDRRGQVLRQRHNSVEVGTADADLLNYLIDTT